MLRPPPGRARPACGACGEPAQPGQLCCQGCGKDERCDPRAISFARTLLALCSRSARARPDLTDRRPWSGATRLCLQCWELHPADFFDDPRPATDARTAAIKAEKRAAVRAAAAAPTRAQRQLVTARKAVAGAAERVQRAKAAAKEADTRTEAWVRAMAEEARAVGALEAARAAERDAEEEAAAEAPLRGPSAIDGEPPRDGAASHSADASGAAATFGDFEGRLANLRRAAPAAASGRRWRDAGAYPPVAGVELVHSELAEALRSAAALAPDGVEEAEFTEEEWRAFRCPAGWTRRLGGACGGAVASAARLRPPQEMNPSHL